MSLQAQARRLREAVSHFRVEADAVSLGVAPASAAAARPAPALSSRSDDDWETF